MDYDGQRLLDVINDPNALESFLGGIGNGNGINSANTHSGVSLDSTPTTTITQQQLVNLQQQIQQQQQQLQQLQQQQIHSPFSVPVRSPAPGTSPAASVILRSPAAPPPAASPSSLASSPAPNTLGHATSYSVSSPAPSPGPQQFNYRAVPSPQQRAGSLSSTPVASPINYPPGPGPGNTGQTTQSVQLPAGTITIPALASKFI